MKVRIGVLASAVLACLVWPNQASAALTSSEKAVIRDFVAAGRSDDLPSGVAVGFALDGHAWAMDRSHRHRT